MTRCARPCRSSIILQDCGKDYRDLDRVYIPQDALARMAPTVETLAADKATPAAARLPA